MTEKNRVEELDKILMGMALIYEKEIIGEIADAYHNLFAPYSVEDIGAACQVWMSTSRWFPKPSDIINLIIKNRGPQVSIESRAQQQWRQVMEQIHARGMHRGRPKFEDPITNHLLSHQFSWQRLCDMSVKEEHWEQARFIEAYGSVDENKIGQIALESNPKLKALVDKIGG